MKIRVPFNAFYQGASQKHLPHILKLLKFPISNSTILCNGHVVFPNKYHIYLLILCLLYLKFQCTFK